MRRWHSEMPLMRRRWRMELAKHGNSDPNSKWCWGMPLMALAPPSLAAQVDCHCAQGIGSMRKRKPLDCTNPRCGLCHFEKFFVPKAREQKKREAILFDLAANGGLDG